MNDRYDSRTPLLGTTFGLLRTSAALGASIALVYALWQMWTAIGLSGGAPFLWRVQLLLLEGGLPLLFALGLGCAAYSNPTIRRAGWGLVIALIIFSIVWTRLVPVHPLVASYPLWRTLHWWPRSTLA